MYDEINYDNLGAKEQPIKKSDFSLGSISSSEPIPESYMTTYSGAIEHQHKVPCCGANAGAYIKDIQESKRKSPEYLWKKIKLIDGFKPEDGTSMEAIFKTLQKSGICDWNLLPNDATVSTAVYTDPGTINASMDLNALEGRIGAYAYTWNPSFDDIKRTIYDHGCAIMLMRIGMEFWTPSWNEKDIMPLKSTYPISSGHFVVAVGYDKDFIYLLNGWGDTWGKRGIGWFGKDYVSRVIQIGTCFDYVEKAPVIFTRTLKKGMTGTDVGILQQALKEKGFFPATQSVTKFFGAITEKAVKDFQHSKGLTVDGVVGPMTIKELQ